MIHSVHKTLPAMTQTALLHVSGNIINRDMLRRFLHIYQSSSPSYILMASIDNALEMVEAQGGNLFKTFKENYFGLLQGLKGCKHLQFVPCVEGKQDIGKLVISSKKTGLSGQQIYDMLLQEYHLQLELAAGSYCLAMFTVADTPEAYSRMEKALLSIDKCIGERKDTHEDECVKNAFVEKPEKISLPMHADLSGCIQLSDAWDMPWEMLPLEGAVGRHVADFVNLYPPGVPLLVPGEILGMEHYEQIKECLAQGLTLQGVEKSEPYWVKVLTI